jgi:hypothetical protein
LPATRRSATKIYLSFKKVCIMQKWGSFSCSWFNSTSEKRLTVQLYVISHFCKSKHFHVEFNMFTNKFNRQQSEKISEETFWKESSVIWKLFFPSNGLIKKLLLFERDFKRQRRNLESYCTLRMMYWRLFRLLRSEKAKS